MCDIGIMLPHQLKNKIIRLGMVSLFLGCFASYIPFTMLTKMATKGLFEGMNGAGFNGSQIQAVIAIANFIIMFGFITLAGWWKYATHSKFLRISFPRPQWFTVISGICTIAQILTVVLIYTFSGISIIFATLLMKGASLMAAPIVDLLSKKRKRKIYWPSLVAAGLALISLFIAFFEKVGTEMTWPCFIVIITYTLSYSVKLFTMSNFAKSGDIEEKKRYFVEEQIVASPGLLFGLLIVGVNGTNTKIGSLTSDIWYGFATLPLTGYFWHIFALGSSSAIIGLFANLMLLDKRENTFCVAANRSASILAGVAATYILAIFYAQALPNSYMLISTAIIIFAIIFLGYRKIAEKKQQATP